VRGVKVWGDITRGDGIMRAMELLGAMIVAGVTGLVLRVTPVPRRPGRWSIIRQWVARWHVQAVWTWKGLELED
jgi:hypothetical protein